VNCGGSIRSRRERGDPGDGPQQSRLRREAGLGIHLGVANAVTDGRVDVRFAGEREPGHDPAERVPEDDDGTRGAVASEPGHRLERAEIGVERGVAASPLRQPVALAVEREDVPATGGECRRERRLAAGVVAEPVDDDHRRRLGADLVALEVEGQAAVGDPVVLESLQRRVEVEPGECRIARLGLAQQPGRHGEHALGDIAGRRPSLVAKPSAGAHRRRFRFRFRARSRRAD
jgi:hypothetical protein